MQISIGSDHRGLTAKSGLLEFLGGLGHDVVDVGTNASDSVDYPDVAERVAQQVSDGSAERGILICGTGIGMAITANKFPSVRAAPIHDEVSAEMSRRHNNLNLICLAGDLDSQRTLERFVKIWLDTEFEGGRHQRRIDKIGEIEQRA